MHYNKVFQITQDVCQQRLVMANTHTHTHTHTQVRVSSGWRGSQVLRMLGQGGAGQAGGHPQVCRRVGGWTAGVGGELLL